MKKNTINLNTILKGTILNNEQLKDMFDCSELQYEKGSNYDDLHLWFLDIIEMNLSNYLDENQLLLSEINIEQWLFNYLNNYLTVDIAC